MNSKLPFRLIALSFLSFFFLILEANAGGSLSREEFLNAIGDESIRTYVAEHFALAEDGRALRAGRQLPNAGERIAPFEIVAEATTGTDGPMVLHLDSVPTHQVVLIPCAESVHYDAHCE
ncbi:MAG: hypothetical protein JST04_01870 [Bdellovibrionales bacterium]|nr:hypothetical protein [Bdellovibrionales bacterium]